MQNIKTFEQFTNEEIDFKKFLTAGALATSLILPPIKSGATVLQKTNKIELSELQNDRTLFTKKFTISGNQNEVFTKVVKTLREGGGYVNVINRQKLTSTLTLNDVKPNNSNGFTRIGLEVIISGNMVEIHFKKIDFFYSGMQPKTRGQQIGDNLKLAGIDAATNLTMGVINNPTIGNRVGSEIQKRKAGVYRQPNNFTYQEAVDSKKNNHKTFISSLNNKIDLLISSF
jgi:hypothetical protein